MSKKRIVLDVLALVSLIVAVVIYEIAESAWQQEAVANHWSGLEALSMYDKMATGAGGTCILHCGQPSGCRGYGRRTGHKNSVAGSSVGRRIVLLDTCFSTSNPADHTRRGLVQKAYVGK